MKTIYCLAATPPSQNEGFGPDAPFLANVTLYVPDESLSLYKKHNEDAEPDYKFGAVLPLSATGIKTIDSESISLGSDNGTLTLSNVPENVPVSVYSITGQLLGTGKGNISVDAQGAQMVIVKVGGKSYKMLAR